MKLFARIILSAWFFSAGLGGRAQTNVYHPFPTDTAYWGISTSNAGCSASPCPFERILQMGDTVVNSMAYKKVYSQWGTFGPPSNCGGMSPSCFTPSSGLGLKCLLRQDSAAKKVYTIPFAGTNQDTLLYDFNLSLGDTLPKTYAYSGWTYPNGSPGVVQKIDSLLINGHYNKVFIIDPAHLGECSYLVEGVGSSTDLLGMGCGLGSYQWVTCFNQYPIQFGSSPGSCGSYAVAGIINEKLAAQLRIYPNPSWGMIVVELTSDVSTVHILDILGHKIKTAQLYGGKAEVNMTDCDNGIYFVEVRTGERTITQKIILDR